MQRIDADPDIEFSIADFAREREIFTVFTGMFLGPVIIASTLDSVRQLLSARYGVERVCRPLSPHFDLNSATGLSVSYSREAHELARALINAVLADGTRCRAGFRTSGCRGACASCGSDSFTL
ncbi:hypothetical protein GCM10027089_38070 [Nocardia thraciensis]